MENYTVTTWQLPLSLSATPGHAASALATLEVQGIAARPTAPNAAFAPFGGVVAGVKAVKRDRATTGMDHTCIDAVYVPGLPAWSPPI
ncbi:hypothetical protein [Nocardioides sp. SYSU DS0651]|uniref:hypothetical protein n=1 Tax=Nocardioides sp. SYSU DS0651 TaxID=3415955 RepID=UPI003F4CAABE